ncbi:MAG: hypothetical protein IKV73_01780, partial [Clostridia bacterium]|nr:hypothetical protein [Clostridia bacterium]
MKKITKCLALLLSLVMLLSVVSVPAMADDLAATTLTPVADAYAGGSTGPSVAPSGTILRLGKNYTKSPVVNWSNGNYVVAVAYDVTSVFATLEANPGYAIKSVKFNPNVGAGWNLGSVSGLKLNFYPVNAKWSEVSTEGHYQFTKENIDKILPIVSSSKGSSATFLNTPAVSLSASASTGAKSFDITSLFKLHQATNQNTDLQNFFSFVIEPTASAGNFEYDLKSKESGTGAALVVEYFKPEALTLASSVYPERPQDDVVLTFSNYIDSATATVNGADV